ncbi:hypothetical protein BABINDRAFT_115044 [Babjeviella inositovora NRRL Y-12698]|uniref:Uncharacterized protein n=1 Tax=Babjeviella inositovora NRRL Y-12698 TaxID=984486 RepID=A0A1E3QWL5_9ASCO|nr:uncharacterized protein BABINDRAFT_115044 [Babjeviella inositovora NRRL Y-12698]ODQ82073.1 hypothetical protein BABINDRAFT_115044 [Babjeviella inositovora NRRL Y-12698]
MFNTRFLGFSSSQEPCLRTVFLSFLVRKMFQPMPLTRREFSGRTGHPSALSDHYFARCCFGYEEKYTRNFWSPILYYFQGRSDECARANGWQLTPPIYLCHFTKKPLLCMT